MIQLAYFSSISPASSPADVGHILQRSRENNGRRGITGMLLYDKGNYLQLLEGLTDSVLALFAVISGDRRHTGVTEIMRQPIAQRDFPAWSMKYHDLSTIGSDVVGYGEFLRTHFDLGALQPPGAMALFRLLKNTDGQAAAASQGLS